ncbi:CobW family GTP-binding protein [Nitratireductor kimnyeongensis]|uniref:CobW family GTP-binding protein n=1 Tax=Nitratireductor kimnyeongensis TaxID=430679 RepID=A0ABW0TCN9_9HYPH|nr:GTP-binding protein [Nitratireductor kimnyeongensis]QZZ36703.1 GTP-binding protein [Nitratireductor kimnyeongensis]
MANTIALTLVTGFLGAGKTTLINRLLRDPALSDTAVIVNEFGAVGIDHLLVEEASDGVVELSDGCLCCTVRGALVDTLLGLDERLSNDRAAKLRRVVIETTGLADPVPVLQALAAHPALAARFRLDGVVTLVDCMYGRATLEAHEEARHQVAVADRLLLTKTDLVDADALRGLKAYLAELAPGLEPLSVDEMDAAALIDCSALEIGSRAAPVLREASPYHDHHHDHDHDHDHEHGHSAAFDTILLTNDRPIVGSALENFLDLLRSQCGPHILRLKGIVELSGRPERPLVVQGVRQILHEPRYLAEWPDETRGVRLVIIGTGLDERYVRGVFAAFVGEAAVDTPDRTALQDNPLAIAGFRP